MERVYRWRKDRQSKGTDRDVSLSIFNLETKGYTRKREIKDRGERKEEYGERANRER